MKPDSNNGGEMPMNVRLGKWVRSRRDRVLQTCLNHISSRMGNLRQYEPREIRTEPMRLDDVTGRYPSIAIVTPTFNQGKFIERTIRSIMQQAYPALRYVVMDGGSSDGTCEILSRLAEQFDIRWESRKDRGQADAINNGFAMVEGEIMGWINSDDLLTARALLFVGSFFDQNPDVDVIYGHRLLINENDMEIGRWITPPYNPEALTFFDYVPQETLFWRRRIWEKAGGNLNVDFHFALDWDLLQRFRKAGAKIVRVPYFLGCFRVHQEQKTSAKMADVGKKEMTWLRPAVDTNPELRRTMTRLYFHEQFRAQVTALLMYGGVRARWL
jgi:carbamoyltransferase